MIGMKLSKLVLIGLFMFKQMDDDGTGVIEGQVKEVPDMTVDQVQADAKRRKFLKIMSQIESSGGKNKKHKTMESGLHAGTTAIGSYGLMPSTIDEMTNRMKLEGKLNPRVQELYKEDLTPQERADRVSADPELEDLYANKMYDHVNSRFGGDEEKMNHSWQYGQNLKPEKLTPDVLEKSPRTAKFRAISSMIDNKPKNIM